MLKLTKKQFSALVGMILGSATIKRVGKRSARLILESSVDLKDYIIWKASLLPRLFQGRPKTLERIDPITKQPHKYIYHQSNSSPVLGKFRNIFYTDKGLKRIPENLSNLLKDEIAFVVWFYDCGKFGVDGSAYLYLGKITDNEAEIAKKALDEKYNIKGDLKLDEKGGYILYFQLEDSKKIKEILQKYPAPIKLNTYF
jgi:hypothetical protein